MLSGNQSFRKLNLLGKKRSKVEPFQPKESLENLTNLVKRLSVQIDDLENWKEEHQTPNHLSSHPTSHHQETILIDPWASHVPLNYAGLLQKLEAIENLQNCPSQCCASHSTVISADGVPWPKPLEPYQTASIGGFYGNVQQSMNEILDTQYAHWCTLLRCLPMMDPLTSVHVRTVALYALREILKCKAIQKRGQAHPVDCTPTKLRDSLSYLHLPDPVKPVALDSVALHDLSPWIPNSETKVALLDSEESAPPVPPKEITMTPIHSTAPSLFSGNRFQKWMKYKQNRSNTDASNTPQPQPIRKNKSWFF